MIVVLEFLFIYLFLLGKGPFCGQYWKEENGTERTQNIAIALTKAKAKTRSQKQKVLELQTFIVQSQRQRSEMTLNAFRC